mmetsp:Transcript_9769/g.19899  ORF Transcript_9769/g.19899 Transcript_9769/m.19899 type:complete len:521 (-) Transcript_9769:1381-2943(-)
MVLVGFLSGWSLWNGDRVARSKRSGSGRCGWMTVERIQQKEKLYVLFHDAVKRGDVARARLELQRQGTSPSVIEYGMVVHASRVAKNPRGCLRTMKEMMDNGVRPNVVVTRDTVLACLECRDHLAAMEALSWSERNSIRTDRSSWNSVLHLLLKKGKPALAREVYALMLRSRFVRPTVHTFNILINGFGKLGELKTASYFFGLALIRTRSGPDIVSYNSLIDSCRRSHNAELIKPILSSMRHRKVRSNVRTSTVVMRLTARAISVSRDHMRETARRRIAGLYAAFQKRRDLKPDSYYINAVIDAFSRVGDVENARKVLKDAAARGVRPDLVSYNSALAACGRGGDFAAAQELLEEMKGLGFRPDSYSICSAICAVRGVEDFAAALSLYEEAVAIGCRITKPLMNALLLSATPNFQQALALWYRLLNDGQRPGRSGFEALIRICGAAGRPDEALRVTYAMEKEGWEPDPVLYRIFLVGASEQKPPAPTRTGWRQPYLYLLRVRCRAFQPVELPIERIRIRW